MGKNCHAYEMNCHCSREIGVRKADIKDIAGGSRVQGAALVEDQGIGVGL